MGVKELQNKWEIKQRRYKNQKGDKFLLNHNKAIATNVVVDENMGLVLFNEILMLASEHFVRFDYGCAPVLCQRNTNTMRPAALWGAAVAYCGFFGKFCPNHLLPQLDSEWFWGLLCIHIHSEDARGIVCTRINLGRWSKKSVPYSQLFSPQAVSVTGSSL